MREGGVGASGAVAGGEEMAGRRSGSGGIEGVIRNGQRRIHIGASVTITNIGNRTARRQGRTGRNYIFPPRIPVTVTGEDAPHIAKSGEPEWEVGVLECPVCRAPNGACTGEEIEAKESSLVEEKKPMRMVRQNVPADRGVAGYVGEEEERVETYERSPRFANNGVQPSLRDRLEKRSDKE